MSDELQRDKASQRKASEDACSIASAMLYHDRVLLPILFIVLALPSVIETTLPELLASIPASLRTVIPGSPDAQYITLLLLDRFIQLGVMFGVALRWRRRFSQAGRETSSAASFLWTCVFGFALWGMCSLPLLTVAARPDSTLLLPAIFLLVLGVVWSLRYYFYVISTVILGSGLRLAAAQAFALGKRDPKAAIGAFVGPMALMLFFVAVSSAPYPDGRSLLWSSITAAAEGVFWLLSTYTTLGFGLRLVDDSSWREAGLDPYRSERLETLRVQGKGFISRMLLPRTSWQFFALALLVFISNTARDFQELPAAKLTIRNATVVDGVIKVTLEVSDPEFRLRGFPPFAFSVATQTGSPISKELLSATQEPGVQRIDSSLPMTGEPVVLYLEFRTAKTQETLEGADNMWLWYKFTPAIPLNVKAEQSRPVSPASPNIPTT